MRRALAAAALVGALVLLGACEAPPDRSVGRARALYDNGQYAEALDLLRAHIYAEEAGPALYDAYMLAGMVSRAGAGANRTELYRARHYLSLAVEHAPDEIRRQTARAEYVTTRGLMAEPGKRAAFFMREGREALEDGSTLAAGRYYAEAVRLYLGRDDLENALMAAREGSGASSGHAHALRSTLASILAVEGDLDEAVRALATVPSDYAPPPGWPAMEPGFIRRMAAMKGIKPARRQEDMYYPLLTTAQHTAYGRIVDECSGLWLGNRPASGSPGARLYGLAWAWISRDACAKGLHNPARRTARLADGILGPGAIAPCPEPETE